MFCEIIMQIYVSLINIVRNNIGNENCKLCSFYITIKYVSMYVHTYIYMYVLLHIVHILTTILHVKRVN